MDEEISLLDSIELNVIRIKKGINKKLQIF